MARKALDGIASLFAVVAVCCSSGPVLAGVVIPGVNNTMGVETVDAPGTVLPGALEGTSPILFAEVINGVIATAGGLPTDHDGSDVVAEPTITGATVNPLLNSSVIPQGTSYNSYLFHFDPVASPPSSPFYVSVIDFSTEVIGVQLFSNGFTSLQKPLGTSYVGTLEAGDAEVGGSIFYPTSLDFRGVEEDRFVLAIDGTTVMLAGTAFGGEIDQIRIITRGTAPDTAVPEPGSMLVWFGTLAMCGFGLCVARMRNQRSRQGR